MRRARSFASASTEPGRRSLRSSTVGSSTVQTTWWSPPKAASISAIPPMVACQGSVSSARKILRALDTEPWHATIGGIAEIDAAFGGDHHVVWTVELPTVELRSDRLPGSVDALANDRARRMDRK